MIDKRERFDAILSEIKNIVSTNNNTDEVLEILCKLLNERVEHYNWVGFYILDSTGDYLYLGPYEGTETDHKKIPVGKGVCGQVAEGKETKIVQDVGSEDNYLSCGLDVQSEIVVPILKDGKFVAELDIDSNTKAPFTTDDIWILEKICSLLANYF